jgi:hypothetical protein
VTVAAKAEEEKRITKLTKAATLLMDRMDSPCSPMDSRTQFHP